MLSVKEKNRNVCRFRFFYGFLALLFALSSGAETPQPAAESLSRSELLLSLVSSRAKALAQQDFSPPPQEVPRALEDLSYQQYRAIRFRPEKARWREQAPFELQFFHPGFLYQQPVVMHEVNMGGLHSRVGFSTELFDYGEEPPEISTEESQQLGFSGFRVHYPLHSEEYKDEVVVFQGASYFRLVGPGQVYGISGRGLAIDTAGPGGEEFPFFRDFWLISPRKNDTTLIFAGLLDSPSATGAYLFELSPDLSTSMTVEAVIFPRKDIDKLGVAPLTSMFHHGENTARFVDDFRPEVHDSDGLLMHLSNGEWVWRPLKNPKRLHIVAHSDENPKGFGLLQRDRNYDSYLDNEADYHLRPSLWVEPLHGWGRGHVELVEIPTDTETNDNIVAYWVPNEPIKAGGEYRFKYKLTSYSGQPSGHNTAYAKRTRVGWAAIPGESNPPPKSTRRFVVDFVGGDLDKIASDLTLTGELQVSSGKASEVFVQPLGDGKGWRASFILEPARDQAADMRLQLTFRGQRVSEVWNYVWLPDEL